MENSFLHNAPLGNQSDYTASYSPSLLYPIPRHCGRDALGISTSLPFFGVDLWNAYEISWLNNRGKPHVAIAEFSIPCSSPHIIESKSFKLYLNSLNNKKFDTMSDLIALMSADLSATTGAPVSVRLVSPRYESDKMAPSLGLCLDDLDITVTDYTPRTSFLHTGGSLVEERLYSHLLKSNCPKTGQPDWATLIIDYRGAAIDHEGLLRYIISFRNHNDFHEHCVEKIFTDIRSFCRPEKLSVYARYTRRGGLDINPFRSTDRETPENITLFRQ